MKDTNRFNVAPGSTNWGFMFCEFFFFQSFEYAIKVLKHKIYQLGNWEQEKHSIKISWKVRSKKKKKVKVMEDWNEKKNKKRSSFLLEKSKTTVRKTAKAEGATVILHHQLFFTIPAAAKSLIDHGDPYFLTAVSSLIQLLLPLLCSPQSDSPSHYCQKEGHFTLWPQKTTLMQNLSHRCSNS